MPRVPGYDNLQVGVNPAPQPSVQAPGGPTGEMLGAEQMQRTGQALGQAGDSAARIALSMQDQVNQVRVNDAVNKARQAAQDLAYNPADGYLSLKGDAALTRPNGQDLTSEYGDKLQQRLSDIAGTLGNDLQRRQFQMNAVDLATQFHGQVEGHMLGEFRAHSLSVQDGTISLASDDAKRNWSDPALIAPSLNAAKAAVVEKGRVSGWSASQTDAALLATTSKVHSDVILSALENGNAGYALGYLNARKGEMSADDILRVQGHVNQQVWMGVAQGAVQTATTKAMPAIAPTSFDRMMQITVGSESGGQQFDKTGAPLTSKAGAVGIAQVLLTTGPEAAKLAGLPWDENKFRTDADYNKALGSAYLQKQLQTYTDPAKAWAAYNAGPGRVDQAILAAQKDGNPNAWLTKLPAETQAYVAKNVQQLQSSGGQAPRPTELDFVNAAVGALPPGSPPMLVKLTREQATQQFSIINRSLNEQGNNALSAAQRWLAQNNGNLAAMPPDLRDAVDRFAPGKSDDLIKYARVFEKGENVSDLVLYNRLAAHPEEMAALSDAQFEMLKGHLSQADFKHFANERSNYLNGKNDDSAGAINTAALKASLNPRMESLGINVAPSAKDTDAMARVGGIRQFVRNSLFDAQSQAGRKFTPAEIEGHVDKLFAQSVEFKHTIFGIPSSTSTQNLMSMQVSDLPAGAYDGLRTALVSNGNKTPTDTDILNLYRRLHAPK